MKNRNEHAWGHIEYTWSKLKDRDKTQGEKISSCEMVSKIDWLLTSYLRKRIRRVYV